MQPRRSCVRWVGAVGGVVGVVWGLSVGSRAAEAAAMEVQLGITATNGVATLSWSGYQGVGYQLESSPDLTVWTNVGGLQSGADAQIGTSVVVGSGTRAFYRVKCLLPAAPGSASFDPGTKVLSVVGTDEGDVVSVNAAGDAISVMIAGNAVSVAGGLPVITNTTLIRVFGLGGNDTVVLGNGLPPGEVYGHAGDDELMGGSGADVLFGGPGKDTLDGNQGSDVLFLGDGDDVCRWDPGDGSDTVEGAGGNDVLLFNGANVAESLDLSSNGMRMRLFRNIGSVTIDANDVEKVTLNALGGADVITVNDLTGTDVAQVEVNLASSSGTGDGQADVVVMNGTAGPDRMIVSGTTTNVLVSGLSAAVSVVNPELANDQAVVNGLGGNDVMEAARGLAGAVGLVLEGGDGADSVQVTGSDSAEDFTVTANGTRVRFDRSSPSAYFLDLGTFESLSVNANGGNDTLSCMGALSTLIQITLDGGSGDDTLRGGNGPDVLIGGDGNDLIDGNQGNDTALMGAGDDVFQWDPGDGSDTIEGQDGYDLLLFNCANIAEIIDFAANGTRLRLFRNVGSVIADAAGVERVDVRALGGADAIMVNSLAGTSVTEVNVDLAGTLGGANGDGQADSITVNGTSASDTVNIAANGGKVVVTGLAATVGISSPEPANDTLTVNGLAGVDTINTGPGVTALIGVAAVQ